MSSSKTMSLLLLPISTRRCLIYCEPASHSVPSSQQSYLDKGVNYAATTWTAWEKSQTKWKLKTTQWGNKMLRGIPFEEWGLKSIPSLPVKRKHDIEAGMGDPPDKVELRYPRLFQGLFKDDVKVICARIGTDRQKLHQRTLIKSIAAMPLTIPFGLLPIVPNLPFFYLAFRAYSHWRALNGSKHLEFLVRQRLLSPTPSDTLDSLYSAGLLHATRADSRSAKEPTIEQSRQIVDLIRRQMGGEAVVPSPTQAAISGLNLGAGVADDGEKVEIRGSPKRSGPSSPAQEEEIMLLKGWNSKLIAERLGLPGLEVEIERAVEQVESQLGKVSEAVAEKKDTEVHAGVEKPMHVPK